MSTAGRLAAQDTRAAPAHIGARAAVGTGSGKRGLPCRRWSPDPCRYARSRGLPFPIGGQNRACGKWGHSGRWWRAFEPERTPPHYESACTSATSVALAAATLSNLARRSCA
eukprot:scaffold12471_cov111-Isochrysis_galbana.AAC.1